MNKRNALREAAAHLRDTAIVQSRSWSTPGGISFHSARDRQRMADAHAELARRLDMLATGRKPRKTPPPDPNQIGLFE